MAQVAALFLLLFGLLPIANWIPGGHDAPWYARPADGVAVMAGHCRRRRHRRRDRAFGSSPALWRPGLWARRGGASGASADRSCRRRRRRGRAGHLRRRLPDRLLRQAAADRRDHPLYQARIFAAGHLWLPAARRIPNSPAPCTCSTGTARCTASFPRVGRRCWRSACWCTPSGWSGRSRLAIGVYLFARLLRRLELRDGTALAALLLYAFAPFTVFLGGSMMNHVTETMWLSARRSALSIATGRRRRRTPRAALAMGLASASPPRSARPTRRHSPSRGRVAALAAPVAAARAPACARLSGIGVAIPMAVLAG